MERGTGRGQQKRVSLRRSGWEEKILGRAEKPLLKGPVLSSPASTGFMQRCGDHIPREQGTASEVRALHCGSLRLCLGKGFSTHAQGGGPRNWEFLLLGLREVSLKRIFPTTPRLPTQNMELHHVEGRGGTGQPPQSLLLALPHPRRQES